MRKRRKTTVDERLGFTLLGDDNCCWSEIAAGRIDRVPLELPDGRSIQPGDHVTRLGGKKMSAGYTTVRMLPGEWLTYQGQTSSLDGTLVVFDTREPKSHRVVFWLKGDRLYHFTPACSGRMVELDRCEFSTP